MADSLHEEALDSIKATLTTALADLDITAARIYLKLVEDRSNIKFPCVLLLVDGERETLRPFDTENDERLLPVQVHLLDRKDRKDASWLPLWLQRRQAVADAILMQVPDDVDGVWHVEIAATSVIDGRRLLGPAYEDSRGGFTVTMQVITARVRADE